MFLRLTSALLVFIALVGCNSIEESNTALEQGGGEPVEQLGGSDSLPELIDGCNGVMVDDRGESIPASDDQVCVTCSEASPPSFTLQDLNPASCGYGRHYGLEVFEGKVTFVVLLRSTCGYCHAQLEKLEQMRFELLAMGHELQLVVINERGTESTVNLLTERTQAPILQDTESVLAWEALGDEDPTSPTGLKGGDKDDMYIYGSNGQLARFLDDDDPSHSLNLSTDEGYTYLKTVLLEQFNGE